ncbi:MAG TPA: tetratricopeptide repeat protein [bacterium]|nr:tetratricopeptide repeat protein [bacterium]HPR86531.1 tetratricopeptide repeat protein [bacterium]
MKRIAYLLALVSLPGLLACSGSRRLSGTAPEMRSYNREAMRHIINGTIEDVLGDPKSALVEYHQAAEIDSASTGIYLALAENYFYLEEFNSSIRMARKALQRDSKNRDALELLAANLEKQRQFVEAAQVYDQMDKLAPNNLETLYSLTTLQIITKAYDKAVQSYHRLVAAGLTDAEYRLRIGHLFFQHQAFLQAHAVYQDVQQSNPDFEGAWLALGALSKAQKDTTEAIRIYHDALQRQNGFEEVKAELRLLYERSGRIEEATTLFRELVRRDSTNLGDKIQLGQYLFQKKDTLAAVQWFEKIVAEHPQSERGYLALGALRRAQHDTAAAIQVYETALQTNHLFLDARRRLRDLYTAQNRWTDAIALYESLTDNDSTYVGARIEIANLLTQKGDTLKAIAACQELEKAHGDDWRVPVTLGRLFMVRRDYREARIRFDKALALRKDLSLIWVLAGVNLAQMDSLRAAENHFAAAIQLFPEDPEINYYLGFINNQLGKHDQALRYLEKAYELDGNNIQTMLALAALYDEVQEPDRAAKLYDALLKENPESAIVLNNYAYHLAERNLRLEEARAMAEKALQLDPENGAYWDTLGWILFRQGELTAAREKVEKAVALSRTSAEVWEHLGDILVRLNENKAARSAYEQALAAEPGRQEAQVKLQQLLQQEVKQ